jgi:3-oxo-5,6-didehydrosuberyl-CoA/3-oxoadipyl-CoA thiolase
MRDAFICDGIRTPIGRYGGALASVRADDLAAIPLRELLSRNPGLDPSAIDDVIFGCANQAGEDNRNVAHMATLLAGYPQSVSGTTINRLCGSGLDAIGFAARAIKAGGGSDDCRRRGIDVAGAVCDGQSQRAVPASGRAV